MLRQIGWDLRLSYPVLMVKRYDSGISNLVKSLYDQQKLGVLLIADDTLNNLERLKQDITILNRPCALVLTSRDKGKDIANEKNIISFNVIDPQAEPQLRKRFKDYSKPYQELSREAKEKKEAEYYDFIRQDGMRCPFMIGLYYQEKDFYGVEGYVSRMMQQVNNPREVQTLAILALFKKFVGVGLPRHFIDGFLQISKNSAYIKTHPYVKAVVISVPNELLDRIDTYAIKHYLIGNELLKQCCEQMYGSSVENSISALSALVVNAVFDEYRNGMDEVYQYLLEALFIDKEDNRFSPLIMAAASPSDRKEILKNLAEKFANLTMQYGPEEAEGLYRMTAHFYGHLGRLCHLELDNPSDAKKYCERSVELMEASSQNNRDPIIYHMLGSARSALFRKKLDELDSDFQNDPTTHPSVEVYEACDTELEEIRSIFEKTADNGSEDYAIPSMIRLYLHYLKKIRRWECSQESEKSSNRQIRLQNELERLFEWSYSTDLSDNSLKIIHAAEDEYQSTVFHSGDAISYYENRLAALKGKPGVDEEILNVRRSLITARLYRHYANVKESEGKYIALKGSELISVLEQIEEVLGGHIDLRDFGQRQNRIICYDRWFYLAKMPGSGRTLERAINYSKQWIELEKSYRGTDPRPYYYCAVCSLLYKLAGNHVETHEIASYWKQSESTSKSTDRLRDILVTGSGMEQLLDMRYSLGRPDEYLEKSGKTPRIVEGKFDQISADRGYITLRLPREWANFSVKFTRGHGNVLNENQRSHQLASFIGFSYEGFRAMDKYVRDITAGEERPYIEKSDAIEESKSLDKSQERRQPVRNIRSTQYAVSTPEVGVSSLERLSGGEYGEHIF